VESKPIKIGLVSFRVNQDKKELVRHNTKTVIDILSAYHDLDLLVFPGHAAYDGVLRKHALLPLSPNDPVENACGPSN
jgi:hypothetical protein